MSKLTFILGPWPRVRNDSGCFLVFETRVVYASRDLVRKASRPAPI